MLIKLWPGELSTKESDCERVIVALLEHISDQVGVTKCSCRSVLIFSRKMRSAANVPSADKARNMKKELEHREQVRLPRVILRFTFACGVTSWNTGARDWPSNS